MAEPSTRRTGIYVVFVLLIVLAGANAFALQKLALPGAIEAFGGFWNQIQSSGAKEALLAAQQSGILPWIGIPTLAPLVIALLFLLLAPKRTSAASSSAEASAETVSTPVEEAVPGAAGLRLLAVLQEEARLVDFVREDLDAYSDEQVGAAVRGVHAALRKAVDDRLSLQPILAGEDGDAVEVPAGFEPARIRLLGNPTGEPPYHGILRHGGWRASDVRLPRPTDGSDPTILAPAEVEVAGE